MAVRLRLLSSIPRIRKAVDLMYCNYKITIQLYHFKVGVGECGMYDLS